MLRISERIDNSTKFRFEDGRYLFMSILYDPLTNKQVYYLVDDENAGVTGEYDIVMSTTDFRKFHTRLRYKSQQKPMRVDLQ